VSTPVEKSIDAVVVGEFVQVPPATELVNVMVEPTHTPDGPPIVPGSVFTVTTKVEGQPELAVQLIVAVPGLTPPIKPGLSTLATPGLELVHTTPEVAQVSVSVPPTHMAVGPSIGAVDPFTVTTVLDEHPDPVV
jgi:hypothetical protein